MNGPGVATQTKLVAAAKEAGTIKQFMPSEFGVFGAVGEHLPLTPWLGDLLVYKHIFN